MPTSLGIFRHSAFWQKASQRSITLRVPPPPPGTEKRFLDGYDMVVVSGLTNAWNNATPATIWYQWNLMVDDPKPVSMLVKQPKTGADTYYFRTRDNTWGILQIVDLPDEPRGVRIRYKLVQTNGVEQRAAAVPAASSESPKLQFLAWQDEWKTNSPDAARHSDGSLVTDPAELRWLERVGPGGMDVSSLHLQPPPRFLHLWFSHPSFDNSNLNAVTLLSRNMSR